MNNINPKNIIFLRMPRCGSAALTRLFSKNNFQVYGGRDLNYWGDSLSTKLYSHTLNKICAYEPLSIRLARRLGIKKFFNDYKFTCVRNPYQRAVSIFNHVSWESITNFNLFCEALYFKKFPNSCSRWHSVKISDHILLSGKYSIDTYLKLENISTDLQKLKRVLDTNMEITCLAKIDNSSDTSKRKKHFSEYYNITSENIIREVFMNDFIAFGYNQNM